MRGLKMSTGKFIIKKASNESYMFNLIAANNEIIATSEMYTTLDKCKKGIASVQANAPSADTVDLTVSNIDSKITNPKFEIFLDKADEYRFRLKAKNGEIIIQSQGYSAKSSCKNGIESVRKNAATEIIEIEN